jgi:hypothetical protein
VFGWARLQIRKRYFYAKKDMALPLLATMGASVAGQGFSALMNARANRKAEEMLQGRIKGLENSLSLEENSNFLNSEEAAGVMERLREQMGQMTRRNERNAMKSGQTAEAQIAGQDAANKVYGKSLSDLAIYGRQKKDQNAFRYRNMLSSLYNQEQGLQKAKADNWTQMGENWSNMGGTFLNSFGEDWLKGKN